MSLLEAFEKWNGVPMGDEAKNDWAIKSVKFLNENPGEVYNYSFSGDTMILAIRHPGEGIINVYDLKVRNIMEVEDAINPTGD